MGAFHLTVIAVVAFVADCWNTCCGRAIVATHFYHCRLGNNMVFRLSYSTTQDFCNCNCNCNLSYYYKIHQTVHSQKKPGPNLKICIIFKLQSSLFELCDFATGSINVTISWWSCWWGNIKGKASYDVEIVHIHVHGSTTLSKWQSFKEQYKFKRR